MDLKWKPRSCGKAGEKRMVKQEGGQAEVKEEEQMGAPKGGTKAELERETQVKKRSEREEKDKGKLTFAEGGDERE